MTGFYNSETRQRFVFFFFVPVFVITGVILFVLKTDFFWQYKFVDPNEYSVSVYDGVEVWEYKNKPLSEKQRLLLSNLISSAPLAYTLQKPERIIFIDSKSIKNRYLADFVYNHGGFATGNSFYITERVPWTYGNFNEGLYFSSVLYHEWMHIVQFKHVINENLSDTILSMVSLNVQSNYPGKFIRNYAGQVGWRTLTGLPSDVFYLSSDPDSQKQSDYGKSQMVEDQAVSAGFAMTGLGGLSGSRIKWMEKFMGVKVREFSDNLTVFLLRNK